MVIAFHAFFKAWKYLALVICLTIACSTLSIATASYSSYTYDENGKIKGCATYQRRNGSWSKHYKVRGEIKRGVELQRELKDSRFDADTYYFYIRWKNGGFSALDIGSEGVPFIEGRRLVDQKGKIWELDNGWRFCGKRRND